MLVKYDRIQPALYAIILYTSHNRLNVTDNFDTTIIVFDAVMFFICAVVESADHLLSIGRTVPNFEWGVVFNDV